MRQGSVKQGIGLGIGGCLGVIILLVVIIGIFGGLSSVGNERQEAREAQEASPTTQTASSTSPATNTDTRTEAKPAAQAKTYQQVFTFSGNGAKKSEPFRVTGDRFKIKYDCSGSLCQAWLKRVGGPDYDMQVIMNSTDQVKDETIFYKAGEYYIESNSLGNYSMTVEDYK